MNGDMGNGDAISQAIYRRNAYVNDYLNVNIKFIDTGSYSSNAAADCRPYLQSGTIEEQLAQINNLQLSEGGIT